MKVSTEVKLGKHSRFAQQQLPAWRPMITLVIAMISFAIIAIFAFAVGIVCLIANNKLVSVEKRYDDICELNSTCNVTLNIPKEMSGDIYLKYKLTRFYQNHRRFMESRSDSQLKGEYVDFSGMSNDCYKSRSINDSENAENWILPCGLSALSVFNDTFRVASDNVQMKEDGIAWSTDLKWLYKPLNSSYKTGDKWLENNTLFPGGQTNEHFIVWMRVAALPTFSKLYSYCKDCKIPAGDVTIEILNNYPTSSFSGTKSVVLSTESWIGPKNNFLGIAYIVVGCLCVVAIITLFILHVTRPRKLGDPRLVLELINKREEEFSQQTEQ